MLSLAGQYTPITLAPRTRKSDSKLKSHEQFVAQMAGSCMQLAVQDLAAMKKQGTPLEQREARLAEGASQMQQLLGLLGPSQAATTGGATLSQVGQPILCTYGSRSGSAEISSVLTNSHQLLHSP